MRVRAPIYVAPHLPELGQHERTNIDVPTRCAAILRAHDIYVAASLNDPCSNALLEALACGLPAAYRPSGGHSELVGDGGISFERPEELPDVLDRLVIEFGERRAAIRVTPLAEIADRYLEVLRG